MAASVGAAFGNSKQETARCSNGPAWGRGSPYTEVGRFDELLMDEAKSRGWSVISLKNDGAGVFAA
jgi:hypothetical protein